jgi:hypothetical protein
MNHDLACKNCRFFHPEGHCYGSCNLLHASVRGEWVACRLAQAAFEVELKSV